MVILIADDEIMSLNDTINVVQNTEPDAKIIASENYKTALASAKEQKIDVAILDIEMPGMNGLELAKRLKEICADTNIIFVTAYSEYALDAFSLYASGYLLKPLRAEALKEALKNLRTPVKHMDNRLYVQCFGNSLGESEYFYLEDTDNDDATITCVTDKLCEAILTYKDKDIQNNEDKEQEKIDDSKTEASEENATDSDKGELSEDSNQKGNFIVLWILFALLALTGIMMLVIRNRRKDSKHNE